MNTTKYYVDWDDRIVLTEDELYDEIQNLTSDFVNVEEFLSEVYEVGNPGKFLHDFGDMLNSPEFFYCDCPAYQEWASKYFEEYIERNFEVYVFPETDELIFAMFNYQMIDTYDNLCDYLVQDWFSYEEYMYEEHPEVSTDAENYKDFMNEAEKFWYSTVSAYIYDHGVKV